MEIIILNNNTQKLKILPGMEFIPQSITTAPFLIHEPFTNSGTPIPTTTISALAT